MRVLVTGATGNLGRAVVKRLSEEGHSVSVLTRRPFLAATTFGAGITIHEWHPCSEDVPAEAIEQSDAVLHLMGFPLCGEPAREAATELAGSRINTTRRLAAALAGRNVRLVVASVAVAPDLAGPPVTEEMIATSEESKFEQVIRSWEIEATEAAELGTSVAIVRLGLIAMPTRPLSALVSLARRGLCPDLRGALIPAIALEDASAMLSGLLQHRRLEGVVHGVAPVPVTGEALMQILARHGPRGRVLPIPIRLLKRRLGLLSAILTCRRQVVPLRLEGAGAAFVSPDPIPALEQAIEEVGRARRGLRLTGPLGRSKVSRAVGSATS